MITQPTFKRSDDDHAFIPPNRPSDSRSPCPGLNVLANHGYIPRNGKDFTFFQLINAIVLVYNMSYPLAILLASVGFFTCGKISFHSHQCMPSKLRTPTTSWVSNILSLIIGCLKSIVTGTFRPSWTLDLQSLSRRGCYKIAHDGSLVHIDGKPSTSPDGIRVKELLYQASTVRDSQGHLKGGLDFKDIVVIRTKHVLSCHLNTFHEQISLGESSLLWEVMRDALVDGVIPTHRLQQWLSEERLPDGWWNVRPKRTLGLLQARKTANEVGRMSKQIAKTL